MNKRPSRHRVLKLRDGTDVIGKVIKVDSGGLILDRPMLYQITPVFEKGKFKYLTISFKKWFEFAKTQRYYFPKDYILAHSEPERELVKDYMEAKKANDFVEENMSDLDENELNDADISDIIKKLQKINPNLEGASFGMHREDPGVTSPIKGDSQDEFWRGIPFQ